MVRFATFAGLLLTASLFAATATADATQALPTVGAGNECTEDVHVFCGSPTAPEMCIVAANGRCIVWGGTNSLVGAGGECTSTIHLGCGPSPGAPTGYCILSINGRCAVY